MVQFVFLGSPRLILLWIVFAVVLAVFLDRQIFRIEKVNVKSEDEYKWTLLEKSSNSDDRNLGRLGTLRMEWQV